MFVHATWQVRIAAMLQVFIVSSQIAHKLLIKVGKCDKMQQQTNSVCVCVCVSLSVCVSAFHPSTRHRLYYTQTRRKRKEKMNTAQTRTRETRYSAGSMLPCSCGWLHVMKRTDIVQCPSAGLRAIRSAPERETRHEDTKTRQRLRFHRGDGQLSTAPAN